MQDGGNAGHAGHAGPCDAQVANTAKDPGDVHENCPRKLLTDTSDNPDQAQNGGIRWWCRRCHKRRTPTPVRYNFSDEIPQDGTVCPECNTPYFTIACVVLRDEIDKGLKMTHVVGSILDEPNLFSIIKALVQNEVTEAEISQRACPSAPTFHSETISEHNLPHLSFGQWTNALFGINPEALRPPFEVNIKKSEKGVVVAAAITRRALTEWWEMYSHLVLQGIR